MQKKIEREKPEQDLYNYQTLLLRNPSLRQYAIAQGQSQQCSTLNPFDFIKAINEAEDSSSSEGESLMSLLYPFAGHEEAADDVSQNPPPVTETPVVDSTGVGNPQIQRVFYDLQDPVTSYKHFADSKSILAKAKDFFSRNIRKLLTKEVQASDLKKQFELNNEFNSDQVIDKPKIKKSKTEKSSESRKIKRRRKITKFRKSPAVKVATISTAALSKLKHINKEKTSRRYKSKKINKRSRYSQPKSRKKQNRAYNIQVPQKSQNSKKVYKNL